jgi:two-component system KDP operon response regulator KdpE
VQALDVGADDYICKPFGINEVLARIRVALRHSVHVPIGTEPRIIIGPLQIDLEQRQVMVDGNEVRLTPAEYDLLKVLVKHRGKIMTPQMLIAQVWGAERDIQAHYLHVYIGQLRRKIEPDPTRPRLLLTVSGAGYRFSEE